MPHHLCVCVHVYALPYCRAAPRTCRWTAAAPAKDGKRAHAIGCDSVLAPLPRVASTSDAVMRPFGPLPAREDRSTPSSLASFLAYGVAMMRPSALFCGAGAGVGGGAGCSDLGCAAGGGAAACESTAGASTFCSTFSSLGASGYRYMCPQSAPQLRWRHIVGTNDCMRAKQLLEVLSSSSCPPVAAAGR